MGIATIFFQKSERLTRHTKRDSIHRSLGLALQLNARISALVIQATTAGLQFLIFVNYFVDTQKVGQVSTADSAAIQELSSFLGIRTKQFVGDHQTGN